MATVSFVTRGFSEDHPGSFGPMLGGYHHNSQSASINARHCRFIIPRTERRSVFQRYRVASSPTASSDSRAGSFFCGDATLALFACLGVGRNSSSPRKDNMGLAAICLVVLAMIGVAWLHFGR